MDAVFLQERITATKAQIVAYENAVLALGTAGGVQSYTIDTGQTRQTVTRADLPQLNKMIDSLMNRLATLQARLNGNQTMVIPAW